MKKIIISLCVCLIVAIFQFGCNAKVDDVQPVTEYEEQVFTVDRKMCRNLFQNYPEFVPDSLNKSPWAKDNYRSASVDDDGNLVLVLSNDDIDAWNKYLGSQLSDVITPHIKGMNSLVINKDFDKIVIYSTKNSFAYSALDLAVAMQSCELIRLLQGEPADELSIDLEIYDTKTDELVKKCTFDKDNGFTVGASDWDKSTEDTEEAFSVQDYIKDIIDELPSFDDFSGDSYGDYENSFSPIKSAKLYSNGKYEDIDKNDQKLIKLINIILYSFNNDFLSTNIECVKSDLLKEWYLDDSKMLEIYFDVSESDSEFDRTNLKTVRKILIKEDSWILIDEPGAAAFGVEDIAYYHFWPFAQLWDFQTFRNQIMNNQKAETWLYMLTKLGF